MCCFYVCNCSYIPCHCFIFANICMYVLCTQYTSILNIHTTWTDSHRTIITQIRICITLPNSLSLMWSTHVGLAASPLPLKLGRITPADTDIYALPHRSFTCCRNQISERSSFLRLASRSFSRELTYIGWTRQPFGKSWVNRRISHNNVGLSGSTRGRHVCAGTLRRGKKESKKKEINLFKVSASLPYIQKEPFNIWGLRISPLSTF